MEDVRSVDGMSRADVRRILKITEASLRSWERQGLCSVRSEFGFGDLSALRTLKRLRENHIPPRRILDSLSALRRRTGVTEPLSELRIRCEGRRVAVDLPAGEMEALTGQYLLPFDEPFVERVQTFEPVEKQIPGDRLRQSEYWFQKGLDADEKTDNLVEAIAAYTKALELNPLASGVWVNLGTVFYRQGKLNEAEKHYREALNIAPNYSLAYFNLANVCDERGRLAEAVECYERSIELRPSYADAHYNLALVYERLREPMKAAKHWQDYLRLDPNSPWAGIARQQLDGLIKVTPGGQSRAKA